MQVSGRTWCEADANVFCYCIRCAIVVIAVLVVAAALYNAPLIGTNNQFASEWSDLHSCSRGNRQFNILHASTLIQIQWSNSVNKIKEYTILFCIVVVHMLLQYRSVNTVHFDIAETITYFGLARMSEPGNMLTAASATNFIIVLVDVMNDKCTRIRNTSECLKSMIDELEFDRTEDKNKMIQFWYFPIK